MPVFTEWRIALHYLGALNIEIDDNRGRRFKLSNPDKPRQGEEAGEQQDGCRKYLPERGTGPESSQGNPQLFAVTLPSAPVVRRRCLTDLALLEDRRS